MYQPRQKDHPAYRKSKGSRTTKSEEDRGNATYVYRWMPQELLHGQQVRHVNKSPRSARRGLHVNPASRHSKRPRQEGSNIRPSEG